MYAPSIVKSFAIIAISAVALVLPTTAMAQPKAVTAAQVEASIKRCVAFLYSEQAENGPVKGGWNGNDGYGCGRTALVTLALLSAGEKTNDVI